MPNLILFNGKLKTQDSRFAHATALALRDGRILAVGSDKMIRDLARSDTQQIDLGGRRVLPGLTDSHFHFRSWALQTCTWVRTPSRQLLRRAVHRSVDVSENYPNPAPMQASRTELCHVLPRLRRLPASSYLLWRSQYSAERRNPNAIARRNVSERGQDCCNAGLPQSTEA